MGSQSPKLSLGLSPPWPHPPPPSTAGLGDQKEPADESSEPRDHISRFEAELQKIEVFKRELPLSVLILNDAIARLKDDEANGNNKGASAAAPSYCKGLGSKLENENDGDDDQTDRRGWMSSAQLWSSSDHSSFLELKSSDREQGRDDDRGKCRYNGKGVVKSSLSDCLYFPAAKEEDASATTPTSDRLAHTGHGLCLVSSPPGLASPANEPASKRGVRCRGRKISSEEFTDQLRESPQRPHQHLGTFQAGRKQRRCWSPDLHRRFVDALEKLGGSQVATPKQIREVMQVDGLTNDEVKSHLQKYRLHVRKLPNTSISLSTERLFRSDDSNLLNGRDGGVGQTATSKREMNPSSSPEGPLHLSVFRPGKSYSAASRCECDDNSLEATVEEMPDAGGEYEEVNVEKSDGSHSHNWKGQIKL